MKFPFPLFKLPKFPTTTYKQCFEHLWDSNTSLRVSNNKPEHVAAVLAVFLERAQHAVRVYSTNYTAAVFEDDVFLSALRQALVRPALSIEMIFSIMPPPNSQLAQLADEIHPARFTLWEGHALPKIASFAVADRHAYRFADSPTSSAACPKDEKTSRVLIDGFERLKIVGGSPPKPLVF